MPSSYRYYIPCNLPPTSSNEQRYRQGQGFNLQIPIYTIGLDLRVILWQLDVQTSPTGLESVAI